MKVSSRAFLIVLLSLSCLVNAKKSKKLNVTTNPCGICGIDVICKEAYPICSGDQIVATDYCGCCQVCKDVLRKGDECSLQEPIFAICGPGLECTNGKCTLIKTSRRI